MIDFRYHLVSIIAVFLALAVGIAVGAEAVSPNVASGLSKEAQNAAKRNSALFEQNGQLKQQISADDAFAQAASGALLGHLLVGQQVVLVTAAGADSGTVKGISTALTQAGATLTGTVALTPQFFDTDATTEETLTTVAGQLAPTGVSTADNAGAQISGQQAAAKVIAAAIMDKPGLTPVSSGQANRILTGFGDQGYLQVTNSSGGTSELAGPATLAVVVTPATTPAGASSLSPENLALVYLTHYLQQSGNAAVLAGSLQGSGNGSAIDAVTSGGVGVAVTTVDNADSVSGQIIVVQALRTVLDHPGLPATAYGVGPDAVPSPAPTSSPTATTTPAKRTKKKTVKP
ncbi:MAG TPA: copper transporter [Streptosporangiaceae bacterium]|nr:copper transporter [Streptosporangiaceae bacterium]